MNTITDKNRSRAFAQTRRYACCLLLTLVCFAANSSANQIDFDAPAYGAETDADADDLRTDDPVEPAKIVLIKSQEDMNDNWNKSGFWNPKETPETVTNAIFVVGGGLRVRTCNSVEEQTFGGENSNNSLYIGYEADAKTLSTGILHLKGNCLDDDTITIDNLVVGNGEIFQGAANANVTLNGKLTINNYCLLRIKAEATTKTEKRSLILNSVIYGNGDLVLRSDDDLPGHVSLMNMSSGDNPFTGSITIAPNTRVTLSGEDAFINASSFTNNGVLALAADQTLNNLSGSGTIDVGEHTLTMNNDRLCQITGAIGGEHSLLIKTGDGTLQIVNQAKGAVRAESFVISSGSLDMEGYFTGTLKVVNDTIEIEEATTFSPGVSLGAIDIDGDFILADGAVLLMEIGGKTFDLNDQLILNGQVTFEEGAIVQFALSDDSTYAPVVGDMIAVNMPKVNWTAVTFSSSDFSLSYYDDKEGLQYIKAEANNPTKRIPTKGVAAVPEPSTWALMALGVVVLFLRKRVRNLK